MKKNLLTEFQLAVHGWSFCNPDRMRKRADAGEKELQLVRAKLHPDQVKWAEDLIASIRAAADRGDP